MRRIDETVDQADGDGFDAFIGKNPARRAHIVEIERLDLVPFRIDTPADRLAQIARHENGRIRCAVIPRILAQATAGFETVAEPPGGQQADARALAFEQRVGGNRGAMQEELAIAEKLFHRLVERGAGGIQRRDHAFAGIGGYRRDLEHIGPPLTVGNNQIGKRAADIDADAPGW